MLTSTALLVEPLHFYDLFFSRVEPKGQNLNLFVSPEKSEKKLTISADMVEQEGVWILEQNEEWTNVVVGVLARGEFSSNLWVKTNDLNKLKSEKYDLSSVGRVKLNARLDSNTIEEYGELTKEDILKVINIYVSIHLTIDNN